MLSYRLIHLILRLLVLFIFVPSSLLAQGNEGYIPSTPNTFLNMPFLEKIMNPGKWPTSVSEPSEEECEQIFQRRQANQQAFENIGMNVQGPRLEEIQISSREQICIDREIARHMAQENQQRCANHDARIRSAQNSILELRQQMESELARLQNARAEMESARGNSNNGNRPFSFATQPVLLLGIRTQISQLENRIRSNCLDESACRFYHETLQERSVSCGKPLLDEAMTSACQSCSRQTNPNCPKP